MAQSTKLVIIGAGIFINICVAFWAAGYSGRTETPPLTRLVLKQPGCESVSRAGIPAEISNGVCEISVRFRKNRLNNGGAIDKNGSELIVINSDQVVGFTQIDDGSDEPWSEEHKQAIGLLIGSMMFMGFLVLLMGMDVPREKRK